MKGHVGGGLRDQLQGLVCVVYFKPFYMSFIRYHARFLAGVLVTLCR